MRSKNGWELFRWKLCNICGWTRCHTEQRNNHIPMIQWHNIRFSNFHWIENRFFIVAGWLLSAEKKPPAIILFNFGFSIIQCVSVPEIQYNYGTFYGIYYWNSSSDKTQKQLCFMRKQISRNRTKCATKHKWNLMRWQSITIEQCLV